MHRRVSFVGVVVLLAVSVIGLVPGAAAQDGGVRRIPVTGQMFVAKLSPDGRTLAVAETGVLHDDEIVPDLLPIRLIDLDTGGETLLIGQTDYATDIAWSPDGATLASYHGGGYLSLWDVATATERTRILALPFRGRMAYLPDGRTIATQGPSSQPTIYWWDTESGAISAVFARRYATVGGFMEAMSSGPVDGIAAFAVMPDGSGVVVATMYGNVWRWDADGDLPNVLVLSEETVPRLDIRFMTVLDNGTIVHLDLHEDPKIRFIDPITGAESAAIPANTRVAPAITPDGSRVAWLDDDSGDLMLWDAAQPDALATVDLPEIGRLAPIPISAVTFLPGADQALITGYANLDTPDNEVWIVDLP